MLSIQYLRKMRWFAALPLFLCFTASAQVRPDTILLLNGQQLICPVIDTSFFGVKVNYQKRNKQREMIVEGERIFSVKFGSNGQEKIYYKQDSAFENYFTVDETRLFIKGEQDAAKYKPRFATASSIVIGVSSIVVLPSIFSLAPPFAYSASTLVPKIRIKHSTVSNPAYLNYDTYILGYERVARKKRLVQSLKGSVCGLAIGFAGVFVYSNYINK